MDSPRKRARTGSWDYGSPRRLAEEKERAGNSEINVPTALFIGTVAITMLLVANITLALDIWAVFAEQADLTEDVISNLTYLAVAITCTLIVDAQGLVEMFSLNHGWSNLNIAFLDLGDWEHTVSFITMMVNWLAGCGVLLSHFKIGMSKSLDGGAAKGALAAVFGIVLDFIPIFRSFNWESVHGTTCGLYLALIFLISAAHRVGFNTGRLRTQVKVYGTIMCYLICLALLFRVIAIFTGTTMRRIGTISGVVNLLLVLLWTGGDARSERRPAADTDYSKRKGLGESACQNAPATGKKYLVIGVGSVGGFIIDTLLDRGDRSVKGFDVGPPKRPLPSGVELIKGSITDYDALKRACQGVDVVYTTVALIRYFERLPWQYAASHAVNVVGTSMIIKACTECGVQLLIQTSSSNVCIVPDSISMDMDEDSPYVTAENTLNHYCWTKVQAEKLIIDANGAPLANGGVLVTGVVRPCSAVFGPNDGFLAEKCLTDGIALHLTPASKVDYVYVENVVWGHILLEKALWAEPERLGGVPLCISNNDPWLQADLFGTVAHFHDLIMPKKLRLVYMPQGLFWVLGWIFETYQRFTHRRMPGLLAQLTPPTLHCASLSYAFSSEKAHDMIGYSPLYTVDEGCQKTVALWRSLNHRKK